MSNRDKKQYYECPECCRTALVLFDEPDPVIMLGCNDGHQWEDMQRMNGDSSE